MLPLASLSLQALAADAGLALADLQALAADTAAHYGRPRFSAKRDAAGGVRTRNGRPVVRRIDPPDDALKAVQRSVVRVLREHVPPLPCVYDAPGRGAVRSAARHRGRPFHLVTDLRDFFPSVGAARVRQALLDLGATPDVARLVAALGTLHGHLPQGAPTSGDLASFAFRGADLDLVTLSTRHRLVYTRYADDLTLSGESDFKDLVPALLAAPQSHGFKLRHDKTGYKRGRIETLGVVVGQNTLRPPGALFQQIADPHLDPAVRVGLSSYRAQVRLA